MPIPVKKLFSYKFPEKQKFRFFFFLKPFNDVL